MRKIELTREQKDHLVRHFADTPKKELAQQLGISIPVLYKNAHELQVELPGPANKLHLEPKQLDYLVRHFRDHENEFLAFHLGISETSLSRLARHFGLKKSAAYLKARAVEGGHTSIYYHRKRDDGFIPKKGDPVRPGAERGWFKSGERSIDRIGPEREADRREKAAATRKATRLDEHLRLQRGLPQRTKMKIRTVPPGTYGQRHYLKARGYILDNEALVAYYNENTRRSPRLEANPNIYTFRAAI